MHEDAPESSTYIRGAFFVNAGPNVKKEDKLIDFFILDPNYQVIYSKRGQEEGIFRFNTTMAGSYTFVFSNMRDTTNAKKVTLAIHTGMTEAEKEKVYGSKLNENDELGNVHEMAIASGVADEQIE